MTWGYHSSSRGAMELLLESLAMEVVGGQAAATDWSLGRNLVGGPLGVGGDHNTGRPAAGAGASWAAGLGGHLHLIFVRKISLNV